jgi:hypothetical protein
VTKVVGVFVRFRAPLQLFYQVAISIKNEDILLIRNKGRGIGHSWEHVKNI